ncbi:MAG: hypothetical protein KAS49_00470 [Candidatus Cloacimonetes bacterium]|nr:hypothetical protein [Candidatus Cloacimonadota bacterium]
MKKAFIILNLILLLLVGCKKDFTKFDHLLTPQIREKTTQPMLEYQLIGDPNITGKEAFRALVSTFYKLKWKYDLEMQTPRARWPKPCGTPREEWLGIFGIPVNNKITEIPEKIKNKYPKLELATWEYGEIAEILHIGCYASESETVNRLHSFITDSGYEICGDHEEEYIKGPGMFFKGNPDNYRTIIRYQIKKIVE